MTNFSFIKNELFHTLETKIVGSDFYDVGIDWQGGDVFPSTDIDASKFALIIARLYENPLLHSIAIKEMNLPYIKYALILPESPPPNPKTFDELLAPDYSSSISQPVQYDLARGFLIVDLATHLLPIKEITVKVIEPTAKILLIRYVRHHQHKKVNYS